MTEERPLPAQPGTTWTPDTLPLGPLGRVALVGDAGTTASGTRWPLAYTFVERDEKGSDVYLVELLVMPAAGWTVNLEVLPAHTLLRVAVHT